MVLNFVCIGAKCTVLLPCTAIPVHLIPQIAGRQAQGKQPQANIFWFFHRVFP